VSRRRRKASTQQELAELAARVMVVGLVVTVASLFLGNTLLGGVAKTLLPLGLLFLAFGGGLLWFSRGRDHGQTTQSAVPLTRPPQGRFPPRDDVVDRTVTELLRESAQQLPASAGNKGLTRWSADVFAAIEWRRFEAVVERLFQQAGFETKSQSHGADMGVDVWLYSRHQPGQPVGVVQCKQWSGKRVGVDKIRELRGVMAAHSVARGQFATTSSFTADAIEFAKANGINLLDVDRLLALVAGRSETQQAELLAVALEGDYWRPTCANCGIKLVERPAKSGGKAFWGCSNYRSRRCKTTMPMKVLDRGL
jgi:restriction system protein